MNYLAHVLLSKSDIDYQLGNLLTDTLKGKVWQGATQAHIDGIIMHKKIDKFTDAHPVFDRARDRLGEGYLRGVVIDIAFDHFLSKHWQTFVRMSLADFIATFYAATASQRNTLPPKAQMFIAHIVSDDVLSRYGDFDDLIDAFARVDKRLSAKLLAKESMSEHFPVLAANYEEIETDFLAFFPDLMTMFLSESRVRKDAHFLYEN